MEKERKNGGLVALIIILCLLALGLGGYGGYIFYDKFYNPKDNTVVNGQDQSDDSNAQTDNTETSEENNDTYTFESAGDIDWKIDEEAKKYITLEDVSLTSDVSIKKVKFINISDSLTSQFYSDQQEVIDGIHIYNDEYTKGGAEYHIKASINSNILSVLYLLEEKNAVGICGTKMAVTNIDLSNKKIITQEELLAKAGTSYKKLVEEQYDREKDGWEKANQMNEHDVEYYGLTLEEFKSEKDKYINIGLEKIPNIIYVYIDSGKIKYTYYSIHRGTLFHQVGKGGCFAWKIELLGDYK